MTGNLGIDPAPILRQFNIAAKTKHKIFYLPGRNLLAVYGNPRTPPVHGSKFRQLISLTDKLNISQLMKIHTAVIIQLRLRRGIYIKEILDPRIMSMYRRRCLGDDIVPAVLMIAEKMLDRFLLYPVLYSCQLQ